MVTISDSYQIYLIDPEKLRKLESEIALLEQRVEESNKLNEENQTLIENVLKRRENLGFERNIEYEKSELEIERKIFEAEKRKAIAIKEQELTKALRNNEKRANKTKKRLIMTDEYKQEFRRMVREIKSLLDCPILLTPLNNPVLSSFGHVYEKIGIQSVINIKGKDPIANKNFESNVIRPHYLCNNVLEIYNKYLPILNRRPDRIF